MKNDNESFHFILPNIINLYKCNKLNSSNKISMSFSKIGDFRMVCVIELLNDISLDFIDSNIGYWITESELKELIFRKKLLRTHSDILFLYLKSKQLLINSISNLNIGVIGRFRPFHLGHNALLEMICKEANLVVIGIGSSNRYDWRNPIFSFEVREMISLSLNCNSVYEIICLNDFAHLRHEWKNGQMFRKQISHFFKNCDIIISGNPYVSFILNDLFRVIHPVEISQKTQLYDISGSWIRSAMVIGDNWQDKVSKKVATYIEDEKIIIRMRSHFRETSNQDIKPKYEFVHSEQIRIQQ